jgi:hypothetical protein
MKNRDRGSVHLDSALGGNGYDCLAATFYTRSLSFKGKPVVEFAMR